MLREKCKGVVEILPADKEMAIKKKKRLGKRLKSGNCRHFPCPLTINIAIGLFIHLFLLYYFETYQK